MAGSIPLRAGVRLCMSLLCVKHSRVLVIAFLALSVGHRWVEMSLRQAG